MYLARYPFDIWGILQYIHTILLTCSRNPNCNWLEYDRQFRVKISKIPQSTLVLLMLSYGSCISNLRFFTLHISQNPLSNVMILKVPALNTTAHSYICIHCNKYHPCIHCWSYDSPPSKPTYPTPRPNTVQHYAPKRNNGFRTYRQRYTFQLQRLRFNQPKFNPN